MASNLEPASSTVPPGPNSWSSRTGEAGLGKGRATGMDAGGTATRGGAGFKGMALASGWGPEEVPTATGGVGMPEPAISPRDYSLKCAVRNYQWELAAPGLEGKNYIIVAPTGSGKTVVSALVISAHLQEKQPIDACHVVFVVNTREQAEEQKIKLKALIPGARVEVYTGDNPGTVEDSIKGQNAIAVFTHGKILKKIRFGLITFDQFSLMVIDECHHARKGHPYAQLMHLYLEYKEANPQGTLPQIIGLTESGQKQDY